MYKINEIFTSIQGEGYYAGAWVNFVRFAGCNLQCAFCDTDHSCRMELSEQDIIERLDPRVDIVVLTGGEPTLQVTNKFVKALHEAGHIAHMETNGTHRPPDDLYWTTVSPKKTTLVRPPDWWCYDEAKWLVPLYSPREIDSKLADHHFLQPMDDGNLESNLTLCLEYLHLYPWLRLSVQLHKLLGLR